MVESTTVILTVGAGGSREGLAKRVLTLVGPAKEEAAGGVAGADGDDQNEVAFAETALRNGVAQPERDRGGSGVAVLDRKSTRLNSSHVAISYAVFCLKKKKKNE